MDAPTDLISALKAYGDTHKHIFIFGHSGPDFDSVSSSLAIREILRLIGVAKRKVHVFMADPYAPPAEFNHLPQIDHITGSMSWQKEMWNTFHFMPEYDDLFIFCDHSSFGRLGAVSSWFLESQLGTPDLDIIILDHHEPMDDDMDRLCDFGIRDETAPSTTYLIWKALLEDAPELLYDETLAKLLYAGLIADTGMFGNDSTDYRAFEMAADLAKRTDSKILKPIADIVINKKSLAKRKAEAVVINNTTLQKGIAISAVTEDDLAPCHLKNGEGGGLGFVTQGIEGAEVSIFLRELPNGFVRGSIRTTDGIDAVAIAENFGGGGHKYAAGFKTREPLSYVKSHIKDVAKTAMQIAKQEKADKDK